MHGPLNVKKHFYMFGNDFVYCLKRSNCMTWQMCYTDVYQLVL